MIDIGYQKRGIQVPVLHKNDEGDAMKRTGTKRTAISLRFLRNTSAQVLGAEFIYSPVIDILAELYLSDSAPDLTELEHLLRLSPALTERWLNILVSKGLVTRAGDLSFGLTDSGLLAVEQMLSAQSHEFDGLLG